MKILRGLLRQHSYLSFEIAYCRHEQNGIKESHSSTFFQELSLFEAQAQNTYGRKRTSERMQTMGKLSNTTGTWKLVELTGALGTTRRSYQVPEGQSPCMSASPGVLFTSRFQFKKKKKRFQFKSLQCRLRYCTSHYYPGTETLAIGHS